MTDTGWDDTQGTTVAARLAAEALIVDVDGYEGPLDLLLTLSRTQKVDLRRISVLQLAEQYLAFVDQAKALRIELAADYLVMASWLAYLKSRLLLPAPALDAEPDAAELALCVRRESFGAARGEENAAPPVNLFSPDRPDKPRQVLNLPFSVPPAADGRAETQPERGTKRRAAA